MPTAKQKPRTAQVTSFPAPTDGLVSNRNLSMARGADVMPGAALLENWFPTATGIILRRGSSTRAIITADEPVRSLFTYIAGTNREMFAATNDGIWDITTVPADGDTTGLEVLTGQTDGNWSVVQYATSAGAFLIGVNGTDDGFVYDGTAFYPLLAGGVSTLNFDAEATAFTVGAILTGGTSGATGEIVKVTSDGTVGQLLLTDVSGGPFQDNEAISDDATGAATANGASSVVAAGISFPSPSTFTTADLEYVWVYKQRIWFIQKDSLDAWYLPVDSIGGELTLWPMGGIFVRGGTLIWGQAWSLDSGGSGGLSEQCVFATTEGEVAAYQGLSPDPDQGWTKVGEYRIGKPMGKKAFFRAGGDIVIATTVGLISLASAANSDYAALGRGAVSYPIEDDWAEAVGVRGQTDWRCAVWADGQMVLVSPPTPAGKDPVVFVVNANTGKWCTFSQWDVSSMAVFNDGLFFGSPDGNVRQGWITGADDDVPYVGRVLPLFSDLGAPANLKVVKMARAVTRANYPTRAQLSCHVNYVENFPAAPSQSAFPLGNEWDNGLWDEAIWDAGTLGVLSGDWVSIGGSGHDISIGAQVTSGATVPLDVELIRVDLTYTIGEVGT